MFNRSKKIVAITAIFIGSFFFYNSASAAITINNFNLSPRNITRENNTLNYQIRISATPQDIRTQCNRSDLGRLYWAIGGSIISSPGFVGTESGSIDASRFINSSSVDVSGSFRQTISSNATSVSMYLEVYCSPVDPGAGLAPQQIARSSPSITISIGGQSAGNLGVSFGASPRTAAASPTSFTFSPIRFSAKGNDLKSECSSQYFTWKIFKIRQGFDSNFNSNWQMVQQGDVSFSSFNDTQTTSVTPSFQQPVSVSNITEDFVFKVRATCSGTFGEKQLTVSGPVTIDWTGSGGGGTGTGTGTGAGGEGQGFSFNIPNPLKGGADDLGGLVQVLAQWLFNISIPIAVAMIVYSGVLFLTAQGNPTTITKAKDVLKWAVVGLAIILIGSGFVTLIQSILELGSSSNAPSQQQLPGPDSGSTTGPGGTTVGAVGNTCSRDRDCFTGLRCQDSICKREAGNLAGEPCNSGRNCDIGLSCDKSGSAIQQIDGQNLGSCFVNSVPGGRIGDLCESDSNCLSGLKCNQICQRRDGNLQGEACVRTASPSNCQSRACSTIGSNTVGTCVSSGGETSSGTQPAGTLTIVASATPSARVGQYYEMGLSILDNQSQSCLWQLANGSLPPGLILLSSSAANTGKLSGTPTTVGTYNFTIRARDNTTGQTGTRQFTITISN